MLDFGPPLLTLFTMVIIYVVYLKPKVIDLYGYGWQFWCILLVMLVLLEVIYFLVFRPIMMLFFHN